MSLARRQFLTIGSLAAGGFVLAACSAAQEQSGGAGSGGGSAGSGSAGGSGSGSGSAGSGGSGSAGSSSSSGSGSAASGASGSASAGSGAGGSGSGGGTFKVGVYCPLTGEFAENGQNFKRSFDLYAEQVNSAGGINGATIELVYRDDKGEPKQAANIAQEYAQDDAIQACLGSFSSTATMAAAPILVKAGIPNISPTSSHPDYTKIGPGLFRGTDTQEIEARVIADYVIKTQGKKNPAIVYRQDDWGLSAQKNFAEEAGKLGATVTDAAAAPPETRDFRSIVTSLRSGDPDALFVALQYANASVLAKQMASTDWAPLVATSTSLYTQQLIDLAGAAVDGWYVSTFFYAESAKPVIKSFVADYRQAYDKDPDAFSAVAYDSIHVLGEAKKSVSESGAAGRDALAKAISTTVVEGVTGEMKFDDQGDVHKPVSWLQIQDGAFVEIDA